MSDLLISRSCTSEAQNHQNHILEKPFAKLLGTCRAASCSKMNEGSPKPLICCLVIQVPLRVELPVWPGPRPAGLARELQNGCLASAEHVAQLARR